MKILVIDNYDSFVYNLVHMLVELKAGEIEVHKNDHISIDEVEDFDKILISPGPGVPREAGGVLNIIKTYAQVKSILGVCLGHQAIAEVFGGKLLNLPDPKHGVASVFNQSQTDYLLENIPQKFKIGHYHSWVVSPDLPDEIACIGNDMDGNIMAIKHKTFDVRGVQFHPESVLTEHGMTLLKNWIEN